jgi:hypothetical protein
MKPFRVTDGYTEVTAMDERKMVELFFTSPGDGPVTHAHLQEKIAWRLALWLLRYWFLGRLCGLRSWWEHRKEVQALHQPELDE